MVLIFICNGGKQARSQDGVVAEFEQVNVFVGVVVVQDCRASLALEVDTVLVLAGHLKDFNLHCAVLKHVVLLIIVIVLQVFLHRQGQFPSLV